MRTKQHNGISSRRKKTAPGASASNHAAIVVHCEPIALRADEAAAVLGISRRTLHVLTCDRQSGIPFIRPSPGILLYPVEALRRWINEQVERPR